MNAAPTDREMEILKALWELGEGSVRDVHQQLAPDGYCISEFLEDLSYYEVDNPYIGGGVLWCFADDSFIEGMGK